LRDDLLRFGAGEHRGETLGLFGKFNVVYVGQRDIQHLAVEKKQCTERLILRQGRHILVDSQVGEELLDFPLAHFCQMPLFVKQDVPFNPVDVTLLRAVGMVFTASGIAHLIQ